MFTEENTTGISKRCLVQMNEELKEALKGFEPGTEEYSEQERNVSDEILKKYDKDFQAIIDFFFKEL